MSEDFLPLDVERLTASTGNVYKSVSIVSKRANQITLDIKEELGRKLEEFAPAHDNLEEVMENREQIEISKFYERKAKPTRESLGQFDNGEVYWRNALNPADSNAPELNS